MSTPVQKPKNSVFASWHKEAIAELEKDFSIIEALMEAEKRTAYLGLKLIYVKMRGKADDSIPHGRFHAWVKEHFPNIKRSAVDYCMGKARSLCERMGWKLEALPLREIPPHRLLLDSPKILPEEYQKEKQMLLDLIELRGDFLPATEYKQSKAGADLGEDSHPRGRRPGEGGQIKREGNLEATKAYVLRKMGIVDAELGKVGTGFTAMPDDVLTAWLGTLERTQRCVNEWLKTPLARRNREAMERVQKLYHTL